MSKKVWQKGFTFIELLIVVGTIVLFSGLSLAYYNDFGQVKKLENEAQKLVDVIELAKRKAISSDIADYCGGNSENFFGYQVQILPNSYKLSACCNINCSTIDEVQSYDLSSGITVISNPQSFFFSKLYGKISQFPVDIRIKNNKNNLCIPISISQTSIIEKKSKISCP